jgi:23S rRNA pseudouridine2605 synthase
VPGLGREPRLGKPPKKADYAATRKVGLARALSKLGFCSRSKAEQLIRAGRVQLNQTIRRDPETPVHLAKDRIQVDGQRMDGKPKIYMALNKPRGFVTTASDEKGRVTVYDCLQKPPSSPIGNLSWLAPVGRLDKASEGLLLFTNDSEWAARVTAPATRLDKTYHVQIGALPDESLLSSLRKGVHNEGEELHLQSVEILRTGQRNSWLAIVLDEGKNRHIRRMLEALGVEVLRLIRVAIGPLPLGDLPKGAVRNLTASEKTALDQAMDRSFARKRSAV